MSKTNWAILMSGWGRSAVKTLELMDEGRMKGHTIQLIVYENEVNGVQELAAKLRVKMVHLPKSSFGSAVEYYKELYNILKHEEIDYIFLLGYKHIIREPFLGFYENRIVNIHPSILPSFRGKRAIQQALEYGVKVTGITTHFIDAELDRGTIICQRPVLIRKDETFEELDQRFVNEGKLIIEETFKEIGKNE